MFKLKKVLKMKHSRADKKQAIKQNKTARVEEFEIDE